jgi:hypothetical protein
MLKLALLLLSYFAIKGFSVFSSEHIPQTPVEPETGKGKEEWSI